jgi:hypothetical protein
MQVKKKQLYLGNNRRSSADRRKSDVGPPSGWRERRRSVERRLPELVEDAVSHGEWEAQLRAFRALLAGQRTVPSPSAEDQDGDRSAEDLQLQREKA